MKEPTRKYFHDTPSEEERSENLERVLPKIQELLEKANVDSSFIFLARLSPKSNQSHCYMFGDVIDVKTLLKVGLLQIEKATKSAKN